MRSAGWHNVESVRCSMASLEYLRDIPEETVQQRVGGFSAWLHTVACYHLLHVGGIRRYFRSLSIYPRALDLHVMTRE